MTIKVLNLYAGIGGNRKLWPNNVQVTAVERNEKIAREYLKNFPNDTVVMADAHSYLLKHFDEFDFIWSSIPCVTHSDIRRCAVKSNRYKPLYPDMKLYEEILLLRHHCRVPWVVENVRSYYKPLIPPFKVERHYFWSNFIIADKKFTTEGRIHQDITGTDTVYGFNIAKTEIHDKRAILRNLVDPRLGLHVFNCAFKFKQRKVFEYESGSC